MTTYLTTQEICKTINTKTQEFLYNLIDLDLATKSEHIDGYIPTKIGQNKFGLKMKFNFDYQKASILFDSKNDNFIEFLRLYSESEVYYMRNELIEYLSENNLDITGRSFKDGKVNVRVSANNVLLEILDHLGYIDSIKDQHDVITNYTITSIGEREGLYESNDVLMIKYKNSNFAKKLRSLYGNGKSNFSIKDIDKVIRKHFLNELSKKEIEFIEDWPDYQYIYKALVAATILTRTWEDGFMRFKNEKFSENNFGAIIKDDKTVVFDYRVIPEVLRMIRQIS